MNIIRNLSIVATILIGVSVYGQSNFLLSKNSTIKVSGASNMSDWSLDVTEFWGELILNDTSKLVEGYSWISEVKFSVVVDKMISGRGPIMDGKMKKALKSSEHPKIFYSSTSNIIKKIEGSKIKLISNGTLSMAGVKNEIGLEIEGFIEESKNILHFSTTKVLKMSMFNIERPTAFFGELYTKDEVSISFDLNFTPKQ